MKVSHSGFFNWIKKTDGIYAAGETTEMEKMIFDFTNPEKSRASLSYQFLNAKIQAFVKDPL